MSKLISSGGEALLLTLSFSDFKTLARNAIPHDHNLGLISHRDGNRMLAEIVFTSREDCVLFSNQGVQVGTNVIPVFPTLAPIAE
ncbi:hypothetical protein DFQ29_008101, partial [Apophysomyces sp. BC1021]